MEAKAEEGCGTTRVPHKRVGSQQCNIMGVLPQTNRQRTKNMIYLGGGGFAGGGLGGVGGEGGGFGGCGLGGGGGGGGAGGGGLYVRHGGQ